jgi:hypothetical protein
MQFQRGDPRVEARARPMTDVFACHWDVAPQNSARPGAPAFQRSPLRSADLSHNAQSFPDSPGQALIAIGDGKQQTLFSFDLGLVCFLGLLLAFGRFGLVMVRPRRQITISSACESSKKYNKIR